MSGEFEQMRTADIIAESLIDWKVEVIFGLPGDGLEQPTGKLPFWRT